MVSGSSTTSTPSADSQESQESGLTSVSITTWGSSDPSTEGDSSAESEKRQKDDAGRQTVHSHYHTHYHGPVNNHFHHIVQHHNHFHSHCHIHIGTMPGECGKSEVLALNDPKDVDIQGPPGESSSSAQVAAITQEKKPSNPGPTPKLRRLGPLKIDLSPSSDKSDSGSVGRGVEA